MPERVVINSDKKNIAKKDQSLDFSYIYSHYELIFSKIRHSNGNKLSCVSYLIDLLENIPKFTDIKKQLENNLEEHLNLLNYNYEQNNIQAPLKQIIDSAKGILGSISNIYKIISEDKIQKKLEEKLEEELGEEGKIFKNRTYETILSAKTSTEELMTKKKEFVNLQTTLENIISTYKDKIKITNNVDENIDIFFGKKDLIGLFENYITNACKYADGNLEISIKESFGRYKIFFKDNGKKEIENTQEIFEKGIREREDNQKGLNNSLNKGLGLYNVYQTMKLADGHAYCQKNSDSCGYTFTLEFPKETIRKEQRNNYKQKTTTKEQKKELVC